MTDEEIKNNKLQKTGVPLWCCQFCGEVKKSM